MLFRARLRLLYMVAVCLGFKPEARSYRGQVEPMTIPVRESLS